MYRVRLLIPVLSLLFMKPTDINCGITMNLSAKDILFFNFFFFSHCSFPYNWASEYDGASEYCASRVETCRFFCILAKCCSTRKYLHSFLRICFKNLPPANICTVVAYLLQAIRELLTPENICTVQCLP